MGLARPDGTHRGGRWFESTRPDFFGDWLNGNGLNVNHYKGERMNLRSWILSIAIAIQFFYITGNSIAQEKMDEEAMKSYMELSKPGEEHKLLESLAGEWNMELKLWPEPGKEPVMFKGTGTHEMILGGRFLQSSSTSGEGDMKTESLSIFGFDR